MDTVCVEAGQAVEIMAHVTLNGAVEDVVMFVEKNLESVAESGSDDSEEPSNLSVMFRETVSEASTYRIIISTV